MSESIRIRLASALLRWNIYQYAVRWYALRHQKLKGSPFGLSRACILFEVQAQSGITAHELSEILGLDKGSLSRLLNGLIKKEYLSSIIDPADQRKKSLSITRTGEKLIQQLVPIYEETTLETVNSLSVKERKLLGKLFEHLSQGLSAPAVKPQGGESNLRLQLRRFGYCSGVLTRDFLDTGYGISECELLYLMHAHASLFTVSDLASVLPLDLSTISRAISQMEQAGVIQKKPSSTDRRQHRIIVTEEGKKAIREMMLVIGKQLDLALERHPQQREQLIELLSKASQDLLLPETQSLAALHVSRLGSVEQRKRAREFFVQTLLHEKRLNELPQRLFLEDGISFGLFDGKKIKGVMSIHTVENNWILENFLFETELKGNFALFSDFIQTALLRIDSQGRDILVPRESDAAGCIDLVPCSRPSGRHFIISI